MEFLDQYPAWVTALLFSTFAGATIPLGAYLAKVEHISPKWLEKEFRHFVIAFGGGALFAAVSLVLVPEGTKGLDVFWAIGLFLAGGFFFYFLDRLIQTHGGSYSQLIAMVSDFMPEAMALGAMLNDQNDAALLLTLLIALQNLPEGFNAYREILYRGAHKSKRILFWFCALVVVGPISALLGAEFLSGKAVFIDAVMMFASGGILYLVFQDIAPQAHLKKSWMPPLGAVCGYALGLLGHMVL